MTLDQYSLSSPYSTTLRVSHFKPKSQGLEEFHLCIEAPSSGTFREQLTAVESTYAWTLAECHLAEETVLFRRIFVNDSANQWPLLQASELTRQRDDLTFATSIVEQPPLHGQRLSLWAYHVRGPQPIVKQRVPAGITWSRPGRTHLWTTGMSAPSAKGPSAQTARVLQDLEVSLGTIGGNVKAHTVRTWFYLYDIDGEYPALVESRKQRFLELGLGPDTHYIASTGIAGRVTSPDARILLDAYSVYGLESRQRSFLTAPNHLGPTHLYGVTFERGTTLAYADRRQVYLSGTASIDPAGNTLHVGDIHGQCRRAFDNAEALLECSGGTLKSFAQLTAYVRQAADGPIVEAMLAERCPHVPYVIVEAKVCRPNWLVEIEGIALVPNDDPSLPEI